MCIVNVIGFIVPRLKSFGSKQQAAAMTYLKKGKEYQWVADKFGVTRDTIYRLARKSEFKGRSGATKPVGFRLSEPELKAVEALGGKLGAGSAAKTCRLLVRSCLGFLVPRVDEYEALVEMKAELHAVGKNFNQLVRWANRGDRAMVEGQWEDIRELSNTMKRLNVSLDRALKEMRGRGVSQWEKSEFGP